MCLDYVYSMKHKTPELRGTAYKIYNMPTSAIDFGSLRLFEGKRIPINLWCNEKDYRPENHEGYSYLSAEDTEKYPFGFHLFRHLKDALEYLEQYSGRCLVEVEYNNLVAHGMQWGYNILVAQEMRINRRLYFSVNTQLGAVLMPYNYRTDAIARDYHNQLMLK